MCERSRSRSRSRSGEGKGNGKASCKGTGYGRTYPLTAEFPPFTARILQNELGIELTLVSDTRVRIVVVLDGYLREPGNPGAHLRPVHLRDSRWHVERIYVEDRGEASGEGPD